MTGNSAIAQVLKLLEIDHPLVQAPMAGVSTPAMAAEVSNAGALGSLGLGAMNAAAAADAIRAFRARSRRSLNLNVFCHRPARPDVAREAAWLRRLRPVFEEVRATPPGALREIYRSFVVDEEMFGTVLAAQPRAVSFHFGLPSPEWIGALRQAGIALLGTATSVTEAETLVRA